MGVIPPRNPLSKRYSAMKVGEVGVVQQIGKVMTEQKGERRKIR